MAYRNPFDKCCEDQCCDKCKDPKLEIKAWDCIEVDKSEEWVYTISSLSNTNVVSTDWSVHITKTGKCDKTYDLSVDCDDRKVGVCDEDTPWYLKDKVKWLSPIYVEPICNSNGVLQIGIDENKLNVKDEKVAVINWCTPKYLWDAIEINSAYIKGEVNPDTCTYIISDKDTSRKPIMVVRLVSTTIQQQVVDNTWTLTTDFDYILADPSWASSSVVIPSEFTMELSIGEAMWPWIEWGLNSKWFCVIPQDWIYRVSYWGTLEISSWIIAWRTYLYHSGSSDYIALESRSWGCMWNIPDAQNPDFWVPMWYTINNPWGQRASLWRYVPRQSFNKSWIVRCRKWDIFTLWVKVSTSLTDPYYDYSVPAQFQIQSSSQSWPGGSDQGAYYTIEWIAPLP